MQRLPTDQQSFEVICEKGLYVDKTQWIHRMTEEGQYDLSGIEAMQVGEEIFSAGDLENLAAEALLLQTRLYHGGKC